MEGASSQQSGKMVVDDSVGKWKMKDSGGRGDGKKYSGGN